MSLFPGSIASFLGFTSGDTLKNDQHGAQHNSEQAEIIAAQTKIGTGSSTPTSGLLLRGNGAGTSAWAQVNLSTDITGSLPVANAVLVLAAVYPVGCIYTETTGVNPGTTFGFGTWSQTGKGRVLVGQGTSDQLFAAGVTGGESNHSLTAAESGSPAHSHPIPMFDATIAGGNNSQLPSGGQNSVTGTNTSNNTAAAASSSHNNLPPYQVIYYWTRTA